MKDFKGKNVVITGGATGIGFALAKLFGKQGARVLIAARRESRLKDAVDLLAGECIDACYHTCDVSKREDVEALAEYAWNEFGQVDVIINNSGVGSSVSTPLIDTPLEEIERIYSVNFYGVINGCQVFGKRFIEQGTPAAIYNLGSETSLFNSVPLASPYMSSKHAVFSLTEALAEEVPDFISVSLICPGFVRSEIGSEAEMKMAMDTDKYADIVIEQLKNEEFLVVSHAYNIVRIEERYHQISKAFTQYAPRYEGDDEYDYRTLVSKMATNNQ